MNIFRRRSVLLNAALVVVLVVGAVLAWAAVSDGTAQAAPSTSKVTRGTVLSTVSASGNVASPGDVGVDFAAGGKLSSVSVQVGDRVAKGDMLARVDSSEASEQLRSAQASLAQARANLAKLSEGQTAAEQRSASAAAAQARAQVASARQSLADAKDIAAVERKAAEQNVTVAEREVSSAQSDLSDARSERLAACATTSAPSTGPDSSACSQRKQDESTAEEALLQAQSSLRAARQARRTGDAQQDQSVHSARSQLRSAEASYRATVAQNAASAQASTSADREAAQAQVDSAQVQVDAAERALGETRLVAPTGGTVASVSARVGEYVSGSSGGSSTTDSSTSTSGTSASGFIVLTAAGGLQVDASFSETDATQVKTGAGASVTFQALGDLAVNGEVSAIAPVSTVENNVVTYTVTVGLVDPPASVKTGQTADVTVILGEADDVLTVPSSAVTTVGGRSTVTVVDGEEQREKTVEIGVEGDSTTEIRSGLAEGDLVVTTTGTGAGGGATFPGGGPPGGVGGVGGGIGGGP